MSNPARRAEKERERLAQEAAQEAREAACHHFSCDVIESDWQGRPVEVQCRECKGCNKLYYED